MFLCQAFRSSVESLSINYSCGGQADLLPWDTGRLSLAHEPGVAREPLSMDDANTVTQLFSSAARAPDAAGAKRPLRFTRKTEPMSYVSNES